jgi:hypothetical protein
VNIERICVPGASVASECRVLFSAAVMCGVSWTEFLWFFLADGVRRVDSGV